MSFYIPTLEHPRLKGFVLEERNDFFILHNGEPSDLEESSRVLIFQKQTGYTELSYWAGGINNAEFLSNAWAGNFKNETEFEEILECMAEQCEW